MVRTLIVDDAAHVTELFADAVRAKFGYEVVAVIAPDDVEDALDTGPFDLALIDLSFRSNDVSGMDVLHVVHRRQPATALCLLTAGDTWQTDMLRDAWELFPLATMLSKTAPVAFQLGQIEQVVTTGSAPMDPALQSMLPAHRSEGRTEDSFRRLVPHGGHAKLWLALLEPGEPTYDSVATATGLSRNTIKNYRADLLTELELHHLDNPSLDDMQEFARRCRPFLRSAIGSRGDGDAG